MRIGIFLDVESAFIRAAVFTVSPIIVYSMRRMLPMLPATTSPELIPMETMNSCLPSRLQRVLSVSIFLFKLTAQLTV